MGFHILFRRRVRICGLKWRPIWVCLKMGNAPNGWCPFGCGSNRIWLAMASVRLPWSQKIGVIRTPTVGLCFARSHPWQPASFRKRAFPAFARTSGRFPCEVALLARLRAEGRADVISSLAQKRARLLHDSPNPAK